MKILARQLSARGSWCWNGVKESALSGHGKSFQLGIAPRLRSFSSAPSDDDRSSSKYNRGVISRGGSKPATRPTSMSQFDLLGQDAQSVGKMSMQGYSQHGFLVNNVFYPGSIVVLPKKVLLWEVNSFEKLNIGFRYPEHIRHLMDLSRSLLQKSVPSHEHPQSVTSQMNESPLNLKMDEIFPLISIIHPAIKMVIIGTGKINQRVSAEVFAQFRRRNIGVEVMDSVSACSTFNFLNQEDREVAGFFISLQPFDAESQGHIADKHKAPSISNNSSNVS